MGLGYDGKLYILAFDHRGSFQKKMFGIEGDPTPEETATIADAKKLIFEGMEIAVERGVDASATGVLVDEQFGGDIPTLAREHGLVLAMPVEKSGQNEFDFDYGDQFGEHIEANDPDFAKVLVRLNPDGDAELNERQLGRLKRLADWLHANDRQVPLRAAGAGREGPAGVGGRRQRPLRRRAAPGADASRDRGHPELRGRGRRLEDRGRRRARGRREAGPADAGPARARENVKSVLLGRGASDAKVDHWLQQAAPVEGFIGFAIGRSIWWDALKGFLDGDLERQAAAEQIAENYLRFVQVYDDAESGARV